MKVKRIKKLIKICREMDYELRITNKEVIIFHKRSDWEKFKFKIKDKKGIEKAIKHLRDTKIISMDEGGFDVLGWF